MSSQVRKVPRQNVEACMTCPLCNKIYEEATTITECLHTFCRKCIHEKLTDDDMEACPVCNTNLGGNALEKLRPDHSRQELRAKVFPIKKKVEAPEASQPPDSPQGRRKERSLSSLVTEAPKEQTGLSRKRSKGKGRKDKSSSPGSSTKVTQNKQQDTPNRIPEEKGDLYKPLNCLVEAANRTKSSKTTSPFLQDSESSILDTNQSKGQGQSSKSNDGKKGMGSLSRQERRRRKRETVRKMEAGSNDPLVDANGCNFKREDCPIWITVNAAEDQDEDASLPRLPPKYVRIPDGGKLQVSFIQKYVAKKLNLPNESEVVIMCQGQPVPPTMQLGDLADLWFKTSSVRRRLPPSVGSSGKDCCMVLSYCRKVQAAA